MAPRNRMATSNVVSVKCAWLFSGALDRNDGRQDPGWTVDGFGVWIWMQAKVLRGILYLSLCLLCSGRVPGCWVCVLQKTHVFEAKLLSLGSASKTSFWCCLFFLCMTYFQKMLDQLELEKMKQHVAWRNFLGKYLKPVPGISIHSRLEYNSDWDLCDCRWPWYGF